MFSIATGSPIAERRRCSTCTRPPAGTPSCSATTGSGSTVAAESTSVPGVLVGLGHVAREAADAEAQPRLGDEGAAARVPVQVALERERLEGVASGHAADVVPLAEHALGGDRCRARRAGRPRSARAAAGPATGTADSCVPVCAACCPSHPLRRSSGVSADDGARHGAARPRQAYHGPLWYIPPSAPASSSGCADRWRRRTDARRCALSSCMKCRYRHLLENICATKGARTTN